jgi:hypothetical protein
LSFCISVVGAIASVSAAFVVVTVTEEALTAVNVPSYLVSFALAGAVATAEFVEVWAWAVTVEPTKARPRMATRAGVRRVIFM